MRIFIDANILIDILSEREPFHTEIITMFEALTNEDLVISLSGISISTAFYICHDKMKMSNAEIWNKIFLLQPNLSVAAFDEETLFRARYLNWQDVEDCMQYVMAKKNKAEYIITRNKKDFTLSDIPVYTPMEFYEIIKNR